MTIEVEVESPDPFDVDLGDDLLLDLGNTLTTIETEVIGGTPVFSFQWDSEIEYTCLMDSCEAIQIEPTNFTSIEVIVTDANGCTAKDEIAIDIKVDRNVYFPNTFSPGDTPPNNRFIPLTGRGVETLNYLRIFDRWGNLVYEIGNIPAPTNVDLGWDGTRASRPNGKVEQGVYVYAASFTFIDGVTEVYNGHVTLIR